MKHQFSQDAQVDRLLILGTGTCQLQEHRIASSALIEMGDLRLIFDFGRGVAARLAGLGLTQDDVEHVVLSHFHPDHVSDLIPYFHAAAWSRTDPRGRDLHVHGPLGLDVQLMRLLSLFGPQDLAQPDHYRVVLHEIRGDRLVLEGREGAAHEFVFGDLPPAGNHGLKWTYNGRTYAITGDSSFHEQEVKFLRGVDLAVIDSGHLTDEEIVELAVQTGVGRLVCSHVYRELEAHELEEQAALRGYEGKILLAHDLMSFEL